jgi:hypothetical protein
VFAVFKIVATLVVALGSVVAAIVESGRPLLFTCLVGAFLVGVGACELVRAHRNKMVRSAV